MPNLPLYIADAFTSQPFGGNPAAVCLLERPAPVDWMQGLAREMNLSETAFVVPQGEGYGLRWFTPTVEVDLCGHATLATSHVLWQEAGVPNDRTLHFQTLSGILSCTRRDGWISMDFPAIPARPVDAPVGLNEALGANPVAVGRSKFDLIVELPSEQAVREVSPDFQKLLTIPVRGTIVTARSDDPEFDFVSRFFAPAVGVNEDPVCGSAHCCLGPYWGERLAKDQLLGRQVSQRVGIIRVTLQGERLQISGQAVTTLRGAVDAPTS
jgi:PhzF family phenazine biosynthesis protein